MKKIIGIDIGGTKTIFTLIENEKTVKSEKIETPGSKEELAKALRDNIGKMEGKGMKIGIGLAGVLNKERNKVLRSPNLNYLENWNLKHLIAQAFDSEVKLENDANCFTLAESLLGAAKNKRTVLGITLGTGVGSGFTIEGKIYQGAFGGANELGHMVIEKDKTLEDYCGERFFKEKGVSSENLESEEIFKEYGKNLGIGIANAVNILDPEAIILGGGISKAHKQFLKEAEKEAKKRILSPLSKENLEIKISQLGEEAGSLGAGLLFK